MTLTNIPLRGEAGTDARENSALVPLSAEPAPPAQILTVHQAEKSSPASRRRMFLLWGGGILIAAQIIAPPPMKPFVIAGQAAASFYSQIMTASAITQQSVAHKSLLAQRLANLEANYSEARSKCFWTGLMGPEAQNLCTSLVDQNFVPAIRQIQTELAR